MSTLKINSLLRFSRFLHFVPVQENVVALYNALTQAVIYVPVEVAMAFRNIVKPFSPVRIAFLLGVEALEAQTLVQEMWLKKMLVEPDEDEMVDVETLRQFISKPDIAILYLLVTDACNIACRYCFFEGGIPEGYKFSLMSEETARAGIDMLAKTYARDLLNEANDGPHIIFYGGEAILNWPVVTVSLEYIRDLMTRGVLPPNTETTINTNGMLITPEIAKVLIEHNVNIAISLDGPKCVHDQMRVDHDGKGTYDRVMPVIEGLREMGARVGICCTIDDHNIEELKEITRWTIEDLHIDSLGFNTLLESKARPVPNPNEYGARVAQKLVECFILARKNGVYEDRFMRKVRSFVNGDFYFADCGGCGMQIVIAPDGQIGTCHGFCGTREFFVDPDENFDPREHPFWFEWRSRSPINIKECLDCVALANCGGGCPHNSAIKEGDIWAVDRISCEHSKTAVNFLIRDLFERRSQE